jgi:hypothetical protein
MLCSADPIIGMRRLRGGITVPTAWGRCADITRRVFASIAGLLRRLSFRRVSRSLTEPSERQPHPRRMQRPPRLDPPGKRNG